MSNIINKGEKMEVLETNKVEENKPQKPVGKKSVMITLIILYSLLLLAGILLVAVPSLHSVISDMGICHDYSAKAYAVTIGSMWIALTPSIGYYFATISPCNLGKKGKVVIAIITTLLLVALTVLFFVVINKVKADGFAIKLYHEAEGSDVWFIPLSMVFAVLGIMICYALTLFKINPDNINDIKSEQNGSGLVHLIGHIFKSLIGLILKLIKAILKFKEKHTNAFIVLATILLTWLVFFTAFIFAIICIAMLVGAIIMYFAGVLSLAGSSEYDSNYLEVYADGEKLTLEYQPYVGEDRYEQVYKDNRGGIWYSTDGGSTVYRKE